MFSLCFPFSKRKTVILLVSQHCGTSSYSKDTAKNKRDFFSIYELVLYITFMSYYFAIKGCNT